MGAPEYNNSIVCPRPYLRRFRVLDVAVWALGRREATAVPELGEALPDSLFKSLTRISRIRAYRAQSLHSRREATTLNPEASNV